MRKQAPLMRSTPPPELAWTGTTSVKLMFERRLSPDSVAKVGR